MKKLFVAVALVVVGSMTSSVGNTATQTSMYVPIVRVVDGDTIETDLSWRLPPPLNKVYIRLKGIDTPEMGWRAKCDRERVLAEHAKEAVIELIIQTQSTKMRITEFEWDKYGSRVVSIVHIGGINVNQLLLEKGLAVQYDGGTKQVDWCIK